MIDRSLMASLTGKEIAIEILPLIRVYKDGSVELLLCSPAVPPSPRDSETRVSSKDITISLNPNISARIYLPNIPANWTHKIPILVYFHGGGFYVGSAFGSIYHRYFNHLVSEAKVIAISVEYRLAPENPLPIANEDCWVSLNWVASHTNSKESMDKEPWLISHGDFDKLYMGGCSVGGNIVHNMAVRAGFERLPCGVKIKGAFLSHAHFWGSKPIGSEPIEGFEKCLPYVVWNFVYPNAPGGIDNPIAEDARHLLNGLGCSRLLVCVAAKDRLRDRGVCYYKAVKNSGWKGEVDMFLVEDEDHGFHIFNIETDSARLMIKRLASFLN